MGMARIKRGTGFKGVLSYSMEDDRGKIIGGNMCGGNPAELAREFSLSRKLRSDIEKPVWHQSLRLPKGDKASIEKWNNIADDYMKRLGFSDMHQRIYIMHDDPEGQHIHIIASRVSLERKVYLGQNENLKSTTHIRELEKDYNLRIFEDDGQKLKPAKMKPKKQEIEMALRKREQPLRMKLQALIDDAIESNQTVIQFIQRLESQGIKVRPNLASTGKLNGFSFFIEGIYFKGSQLGKDYKLDGLQKRGLTYEQTRDFEELAIFKSIGNGRIDEESSSENRNFNSDYGRLSGSVSRSFSESRERCGDSENRSKTSGRSNVANATQHDQQSRSSITSFVSNDSSDGGLRQVNREDRINDNESANLDRVSNQKDAESTSFDGGSNREVREFRKKDTHGYNNDIGNAFGSDSSKFYRSDNSANSVQNWRDRFKRKSAATRNSSASISNPAATRHSHTRFTDAEIKTAKEVDPTAYLESAGYIVKREGRHLSVRLGPRCEESYRVTWMADGHWVSCTREGAAVGDNAALVQHIESCTFVEAIYRLIGPTAPTPAQRPSPKQTRTPPKIPPQTVQAREAGRRYLQTARKITLQTILEAENCGFLRYTDGAVVFVGYSQNGAENATKRAINVSDEVQKRDFAGSDKRYPPILRGSATVWIVEGGVDALALHDIALRRGQQVPTVIVSGGSKVRLFLENEDVQTILKNAGHVVIALENEKDADTQSKTDAEHAKQAAAIAEITKQEPMLWKPKNEKDLAEFNEKQQENEKKDDELSEKSEYEEESLRMM